MIYAWLQHSPGGDKYQSTHAQGRVAPLAMWLSWTSTHSTHNTGDLVVVLMMFLRRRRRRRMKQRRMRRRNALLCQVHRCFTNQAPSYLCSKFTSNSSLHYAETWGSTKLHLPHPRTKFYHSSFEFQGAKIFNSLPRSIRELKDRKQFRHAVQIYSL